jgi:hypothetical protein
MECALDATLRVHACDDNQAVLQNTRYMSQANVWETYSSCKPRHNMYETPYLLCLTAGQHHASAVRTVSCRNGVKNGAQMPDAYQDVAWRWQQSAKNQNKGLFIRKEHAQCFPQTSWRQKSAKPARVVSKRILSPPSKSLDATGAFT